MLVDFDTLPEESKVWIYQSNRKFYPKEVEQITLKVEEFLGEWKNEDEEIQVSYQLKYDRFIIFSVNTEHISLSTKTIDSSVAFIINLQSEFGVELLDKLNVSFKQGEFVQYKDLKEFQKMIKNKSISPKTIVFNNLINTKDELETSWEIPITESWHNRFLK